MIKICRYPHIYRCHPCVSLVPTLQDLVTVLMCELTNDVSQHLADHIQYAKHRRSVADYTAHGVRCSDELVGHDLIGRCVQELNRNVCDWPEWLTLGLDESMLKPRLSAEPCRYMSDRSADDALFKRCSDRAVRGLSTCQIVWCVTPPCGSFM